MDIEIHEESVERLAEYGEVPMAITVDRRLDLQPVRGGLGGLSLVEQAVTPSYVKDYDQGESPAKWLKFGDISNWGVLSAFDKSRRIGGAVVAWKTPKLDMLEVRDDIAVLWDIRVHPDCQRKVVGSALFMRSEAWARNKGCRQLKVETQNVNVVACTLPEELLERLRLIAAERRTSMASLIREAVEEKVRSHRTRPRSWGIGASGYTDTASKAGDMRPEPRSWR